MMRCPFEECERATTLPEESVTHLIVAIGDDNRAYIHGPIEDKKWIERMILEVARLVEVDLRKIADQLDELYSVPERVTVQ